jgi:hypothetical protein
MAFTYGTIWGNYGDEKVEHTTQNQPLGTRMVLPDGRTFYYARNSTAAITDAGFIVDGSALKGAHDTDVPATAAHSVGDHTISIEVPTTDLIKDEYKDGYLVFNDGPGQGEVYRILSHPAHDASEDNTVIITLNEKIRTALTTSSLCGLVYNPYTDIKLIDGDGTMTTGPLGITQIPLTASTSTVKYYCWIQTYGLSSVRMGTQVVVLGDAVTVSQESNEQGLCERADYSDESDLQTIGTAMGVVGTTGGTLIAGDTTLVMLTIRA